MPKPVITNVTPTTVHLKQLVELTIHGDNFAGNSQGQCEVYLESTGGYTWTPNPAWGNVVSSHVIKVEATPTSDDEERGTGTGDLTTTVTNGDGSGSGDQTQQETYVPD